MREPGKSVQEVAVESLGLRMMLGVFSVQNRFFSGSATTTLLLGLLFASKLTAEPRQSQDDPCLYRLPHYDEDWNCVSYTSHSPDILDAIKYVTWSENASSYASFGGEIRETYERFHNPNFGLQPEDPGGYLLQRYLIHADLHFTESARGYVELLSAFENWRVGGPRPIVDEDRLDFHQGFLDFRSTSKQGIRTTVRLGRQEMALGSGRLVALREGTNVPFSFDGIRVSLHVRAGEFDVFATKPVLNKSGVIDDPPQAGNWFWGIYSSWPMHAGTHPSHVDVYYLGLDRNPATFNQGTAHETRHTIGGRIWNLQGAWNYDAEGMFQFGSFVVGTIHAWRVASDTSYEFSSLLWHPRLGFTVDASSGDRNLANPDLQTFNALFQSGTYSGKAQILGPANTIRLEPFVTARTRRNVSVSAGWGFYWRESVHDGLYGIAGNLLVPAGSTRARYEGSRPLLQVDWQVTRHISCHVNYIYVFNGPFGEQAAHGTSGMSYVAPWITYEF
jgi:Alginate export